MLTLTNLRGLLRSQGPVGSVGEELHCPPVETEEL